MRPLRLLKRRLNKMPILEALLGLSDQSDSAEASQGSVRGRGSTADSLLPTQASLTGRELSASTSRTGQSRVELDLLAKSEQKLARNWARGMTGLMLSAGVKPTPEVVEMLDRTGALIAREWLERMKE